MAVFLSPGVFPREIDLSALPSSTGPLIPAFIGTANKGPMNTPTFISNSQRFIDTFGEPFVDSNLGYGVLAYLEEGNAAWILRVGVECETGQATDLADICVDVTGGREGGWGRVPIFTGIDFGEICLRLPSVDDPYEFHADAVLGIDFTDVSVSSTDGAADAILDFTGAGLSDSYTGAIDDSFSLLITSAPTSGVMEAAGFEIVRNSDGTIIVTGTITESGLPGTSDPIVVGTGDDASGLTTAIVVTGSSPLEADDFFTWQVRPDNLSFEYEVDGLVDSTHSFTAGETFTTPAAFVTAFNALVGASFGYSAAFDGTTLCIRTNIAGERIQLVSTEAFALEAGVALFAFDIPRSHLIGDSFGAFNISTSNNRVNVLVIQQDGTLTETETTVTTGTALTVAQVAASLTLGGLVSGDRFWSSYALQVTDDDFRLVVETSVAHQFDQLKMQVDASHIKTLRFAEEVEIPFPYTRAFRGFSDTRAVMPDPGLLDAAVPLSCEVDPASDDCSLDTAYFAGIVGFLVASSPGTWLNNWSVTLSVDTANSIATEKFTLDIFDDQGTKQDSITEISFDSRDARYIGSLLNPGTDLGGINGNAFFHWEPRPTALDNDVNDLTSFTVRIPAPVNTKAPVGMANGIPATAALSSELDRFIIGNPANATGMFAFSNPETFDINMLIVPGNSSGAVIAQGLQLCEGRGDCIYIIDPPFGLRPQQVVDWHNGMLLSDLTAALNSSYGALYWSWIKIFDQFNGGTLFIPPSGHVTAVFSRTARDFEQWFAPAGLRRGRLLTALDVEFNPTQGERDLLYGFNNAVNPIVSFPQDGITVFGQRTLQRADTALDRVNVRMLLIFLKKAMIPLLRQFIFEINDDVTRSQITSILTSFMNDILARRGVTAFKVICDETNNTPERIDRNELHVAVLLKPARVAEFIVLNLVVLRTDASFSADEVLQAAGVVQATGG